MTKDDRIEAEFKGIGKELDGLREVLNGKLDELVVTIHGIVDDIAKGSDGGKPEAITVPKHPYHTPAHPQGTCRVCLPLERESVPQDEEALELHAHDLLLRLRQVMDSVHLGFRDSFEDVAGLVGALIVELRETAIREVGDDPFLIRSDEREAVMDALAEVYDRINTERDHGNDDPEARITLDRVLSRMGRASPPPKEWTVQVRLVDLKGDYHVVEVPVSTGVIDARVLTVCDNGVNRYFVYRSSNLFESVPAFVEAPSAYVIARLDPENKP